MGRTFKESVQKALRGLETGLNGFDEVVIDGADDFDTGKAAVIRRLGIPAPDRLLVIAQAFRHGLTVEEIEAACSYEPWFLRQIAEIVREEGLVRAGGLPTDAVPLRRLKSMGFSDARLAHLTHAYRGRRPRRPPPPERAPGVQAGGQLRCRVRGPYPLYVFHLRNRRARPDSRMRKCAYRTARRRSFSAAVRTGSVRGSSSTIAAATPPSPLTDLGIESIMVNCNPETVSTDYDTSDRLYFEPLTAEDVLELIHVEQSNGTLARRHRPVRRTDAAEARPPPRTGRRAHPWHHAGRHRPRRRPRAVPADAGRDRPASAGKRHRPHLGRGADQGRDPGLSLRHAALIRAWAAGAWRSSATRPGSIAISPTQGRSPPTIPSCSTITCQPGHRGGRGRHLRRRNRLRGRA